MNSKVMKYMYDSITAWLARMTVFQKFEAIEASLFQEMMAILQQVRHHIQQDLSKTKNESHTTQY